MREWFLDIGDLFELVFLEPFRYSDEVEEIPISQSIFFKRLVWVLAALSLSLGSGLLSVPYTLSTLSLVGIGFIMHLVFLKMFIFLFAVVFDSYAQKKGRPGNAKQMQGFLSYALSFFALFTPMALVFLAFGVSGQSNSLALLLLFVVFFAVLASRGGSYIYDLKPSDSLRFSFLSLGFCLLFPFIFSLYSITSLLQSVAGGF